MSHLFRPCGILLACLTFVVLLPTAFAVDFLVTPLLKEDVRNKLHSENMVIEEPGSVVLERDNIILKKDEITKALLNPESKEENLQKYSHDPTTHGRDRFLDHKKSTNSIRTGDDEEKEEDSSILSTILIVGIIVITATFMFLVGKHFCCPPKTNHQASGTGRAPATVSVFPGGYRSRVP